MSEIPHSPSSVPAQSATAEPPRDLLTVGMIDALKATKPWVRFLSIVGFVTVGLMMLAALGMGGLGFYQMANGNSQGTLLAGMAVLYLVMAILYVFPSRYLFRYAGAIQEALGARWKSASVERALRYQKSFWKFTGIMMLVVLLLYIPGILAAIAIPNFLTAMQRSRQKRTMADMRTIATALDSFTKDQNRYPNVATVAELAPDLEPNYVKTLPRVDGWGNAFVYEPSICSGARCAGYYIGSGGKNGSMEKRPSEYGLDFTATRTFDEDIVFANGSFTRAPEGVPGN